MIVYLHKQGHDYTLRYDFLEYWRPDLAKIVRLQSYESLFQAERLPLCTYVFSDIERLDPDEQEMAARIYEKLAVADPDGIRLNHPLHSRRRFGLLRSLRDAGMNAFDAYRAGDDPRPKRFPVLCVMKTVTTDQCPALFRTKPLWKTGYYAFATVAEASTSTLPSSSSTRVTKGAVSPNSVPIW